MEFSDQYIWQVAIVYCLNTAAEAYLKPSMDGCALLLMCPARQNRQELKLNRVN